MKERHPIRAALGISQSRGFLLIIGMFALAGLAGLVPMGLNRSMGEARAATRSAQLQQAFYLAEAGLDAKLVQLRDADAANDATPLNTTYPSGTVAVVAATGAAATEWHITSTGTAGDTQKTLRMTARKTSGGAAPGAATIVDDDNMGMRAEFYDSSGDNLKIDGCDAANPGTCLPALVMTSANAYANFVTYINTLESSVGYFGDRIVGAPGDYNDGQPSGHYSIDHIPQDPTTGLNYAWLGSLAKYAKDSSGAYNCKFGDSVSNQTFGTLAAPKICYAKGDAVEFSGINRGAGVLVVEGTMAVGGGNIFEYDGLVVVIGQETDLDGTTTIRGAFLGSHFAGRHQLSPSCKGLFQYDSSRLAMVATLLQGWTPPSGTGFGSGGSGGASGLTIEAWQEQ